MSADSAQLDDVQARVARIEQEIKGVASQCGVKSADQQFMRSLVDRRVTKLTPPQGKWLADIEKRVFEDEDVDG